MMDVHVSTMGNLVVLVLPPLTLHDYMPPPPQPAVPPFVPCVETPVPVMWPPGFGMQQNKLTTTVIHKFQFLMLEGHDCGYMIPHVTIPANNLQIPLLIAFSSRKAMFSASTVKANGTAMGCSQLLLFPLPMMPCWSPVSLPSAFPVLNVINNVTAGMTWGDFFAGIAAILIAIAADALGYWAKDVAKFPLFKSLFPSDLAGKLFGKLLGGSSVGALLVKTAAGVLTGAAKILLTGEGSIKIAIGSSYAGGNVSYTRTLDGQNQFQIQGQLAPPGLPSVVGSVQHTSNADGSTSNKTSVSAATAQGQVKHESKTDRDASGKVTKTTETDTATGGAPLPEGGIAATKQTKTETKPGEKPKTTEGSLGGVGTPFGGVPLWGAPL
jgi:hypothetical protein